MIVLPLYAVLVWSAMYFFRRRLIGYAVWCLSWLPVFAATYLCIQHMPLPDHEPRPVWLYGIAASYGVLIMLVGGIIVIQRDRHDHHCHHCGYDLAGNRLGLCPECGTPMRCHACHALQTREDHDACHVCGTAYFELPESPSRVTQPEIPAPRPSRERIERYVQAVAERG